MFILIRIILNWSPKHQIYNIPSSFWTDYIPLITHFTPYASVNMVSIGFGNGLSPVRHQALIWTNSWLLSIAHIRTNFNGNWITMLSFSFKKMHLSSAKVAAISTKERRRFRWLTHACTSVCASLGVSMSAKWRYMTNRCIRYVKT